MPGQPIATAAALLLALAAAPPARAAEPATSVADLDGEWDGTLFLGSGLNLRLAFHIADGPQGARATFDSVDQGAYGAPVASVDRRGDRVRLEMPAIGARVKADLLDHGETLAGVFTQNGLDLPLTLHRLAPGAAPPWPTPVKAPRAEPSGRWTVPSDAEIVRLLADRIDVQRQGVGIVVGVIGPDGRRIVAYGRRDQGDSRPIDGDTEFEIGSITKVFTALILADMAARGEVKLNDAAAKYLPPKVTMPEHDGKAITLADLATHVSGLPRMPTNFAPKDPSDPYADYTEDRLHAFLSAYRPPRDPGAKWEYSNLGVGLLGQLLARRAGVDYETLVKTRVLAPLGMTDSAVTLSPGQRARLAVGHDSRLAPAANWNLGALTGAGGLRSTANDLLTFLAAELGYADTPLKADMASLLAVKRPTGSARLTQALGWELLSTPAGEIVQHGGGTGGYHALVAFDPKARTGVVVLTNAETPMGADDIGLHILTGAPVATLPPPPPAPPERHAIAVAPESLDRLVGRYRLAPGVVLAIARDGDHLTAQLTGQPAFEIFGQSATAFFWKVVDAQVSFDVGADGRATALTLHQNGRDLPGRRFP